MASRILTALLALLIAIRAEAFIEAPISLRELYGISSVVAVVEVVEGRVVTAGGESCGARYKGRVIEGTKNATVGQLIEFGLAPSLKIGARYFVLLDAYENSPLFQRLPEVQPRCKSVLPGLTLARTGRSAMEITTSIDDPARRDAWTVRRAKLVEYPIGTRSTLVDGERQLVYTDMVKRMKDQGFDPR